MAYRISPQDDSLQTALRRITEGELDPALAALADTAHVPAAAIHDVRKRIKKLRGLLRLVRPGFAGFAAENAALRDAARHLSTLRDAEVRLATFDRLFPDPPPLLQPLRDNLAAARSETASAPGQTGEAAGALSDLRARARDWRLKGRDRDILHEGLARTRLRARATLMAAEKAPLLEPMHEWRKRAKDHWYQARLLAPIWPEAMAPVAEAASTLTEDLGDHHDLGVLADHAAAVGTDDAALHLVGAGVARAQAAIEERVFPLGHRLFAGDPGHVADLWLRWWQLWRG